MEKDERPQGATPRHTTSPVPTMYGQAGRPFPFTTQKMGRIRVIGSTSLLATVGTR